MSHIYRNTLGSRTYQFRNLAELMAKAAPRRAGDPLADIECRDNTENEK